MSKWRLMALIVATALVVDQWTKFLAVERLTTVFERSAPTLAEKVKGFYTIRHLEPFATEPHYVFRPWWRMNYAENTGAAWGLFRGMSLAVRVAFFGVIVLAASIFIVHSYRRLRPEQRFLQVALSMILAGAWGNYIDRLVRGYVVDFVEWYWWNRPDLRWPTFNVADSLIVVGVLMLVVHPAPKQDQPARE
jgi:signal peptidase II